MLSKCEKLKLQFDKPICEIYENLINLNAFEKQGIL